VTGYKIAVIEWIIHVDPNITQRMVIIFAYKILRIMCKVNKNYCKKIYYILFLLPDMIENKTYDYQQIKSDFYD